MFEKGFLYYAKICKDFKKFSIFLGRVTFEESNIAIVTWYVSCLNNLFLLNSFQDSFFFLKEHLKQ